MFDEGLIVKQREKWWKFWLICYSVRSTSRTLEISMRDSAGILTSEHSMEYPQSSVHSCPDWRYHLRSEVRHGIINQMVAVLTRISNRIVTDRVYNFETVGVKLEEAAYNRANCQEEYVQRICAKLAHFWMQTINRQANSSNRNANYVHQATRSSNQAANMNNAPHWQGVTVTSKIYLTRIRFLSETRNKNEIPNSTARKRRQQQDGSACRKRGRKTRHGSTGWTQLRQ